METDLKILRPSSQWMSAAGVLLAGLIGIAAWQFFTLEGPHEQELRLQHEDARAAEADLLAAKGSALKNCQRAIQNAARDPRKASIPDVSAMEGGADFRFLWPSSQPVRLRNGLGLEVATQAFCVVNEKTGKIKLLTLDGKTVIALNG